MFTVRRYSSVFRLRVALCWGRAACLSSAEGGMGIARAAGGCRAVLERGARPSPLHARSSGDFARNQKHLSDL